MGREPQLTAQVLGVGNHCLFRSAADRKLTHNAADHIQIDIQHAVLKCFLILAVGLGPQQSPLFTAAPDKAQTVVMGMLRKMLQDAQQTDGAGHIVICTLGQVGGIIMGCECNILIGLAGNIQDHVVGIGGIFFLPKGDFRGSGTLADQFHRITDMDIHAGDPVALMDPASQLPLVNILIRILQMSTVRDKAHRTGFQNILIQPVAHPAVDHDDLPPTAAQRQGILVPQIIEGRFQFSVSGAQVALAGYLHTIHCQHSLLHCGHGDLKGYDPGRISQLRHLVPDIFRSHQLLRASAQADIGCVFKNLHDSLCVHCHFLAFSISCR